MPAISVIIPVRDGRGYLQRTLPPLLAGIRSHGDAELIVSDNGSQDGSGVLARELGGEAVRVIECPGVRVGEVRNVGARAATAPVLVFLDADCQVTPGYLDAVEAGLRGSPEVTGIGCTYDLPDDPQPWEAAWQSLHPLPPDGPAEWLFGGNCAYRTSAFLAVGGFDPTLLSGEDAELGLRLTRAGHQLETRSAMQVRHLGNPDTLAGFFRQQVWHGMGMFGTARIERLDRPTIMLAVWLLCHAVALGRILDAPLSAASWLGAVPLVLAVPMAAVLYRVYRGGSPEHLGRAVALYWTYFAARAWALARILGAAVARWWGNLRRQEAGSA